MSKQTKWAFMAGFGACAILLAGLVVGLQSDWFSVAEAARGIVRAPNGIVKDRYVYYPGTEELKPDEIRLIACGTGMPAARHGQAATSWLVEAGNGDKFSL